VVQDRRVNRSDEYRNFGANGCCPDCALIGLGQKLSWYSLCKCFISAVQCLACPLPGLIARSSFHAFGMLLIGTLQPAKVACRVCLRKIVLLCVHSSDLPQVSTKQEVSVDTCLLLPLSVGFASEKVRIRIPSCSFTWLKCTASTFVSSLAKCHAL